MKAVKLVMLIIGILAFSVGTCNIIFEEISIHLFGFISGAFLIWLFFNIEKLINKGGDLVLRRFTII